MIRTQVSLDEEKYKLAKREARALGISVAEFVRRAIRQSLPPADALPGCGMPALSNPAILAPAYRWMAPSMARKTECYVGTSALIAFPDRSDSHYPLFRRRSSDPPPLIETPAVAHGLSIKRGRRTIDVGRTLSAKGAFPAPPLNKKNRRNQAARGARFARFLESPPGALSAALARPFEIPRPD